MNMKSLKSVFFTLGVCALIVVGLVLLSGNSASQSRNSKTTLTAEQTAYDFGSVSMAKGKVSYVFTLKNPSSGPLEISKLYTSCMCTESLLTLSGQTFGPYGMPGHGLIPSLNQTLAPGQQAALEVIFDPAAHGPAGVGPIARTVTVETPQGNLTLNIKALVTP